MFNKDLTIPKAPAVVSHSSDPPQASRNTFFGRLRRPAMPSPPIPPVVPSVASSSTKLATLVGPTIAELTEENAQFLHRCEELAMQSQLNQQLFQRCSADLLAKESEARALELQVSVLVTQLAKAKEAAVERRKLLMRLEEQHQHLVDVYTREQIWQTQQNEEAVDRS